MTLSVQTGWYWTRENELRECVVLEVWGDLSVIDFETGDVLDVSPDDVLIEKPEP